MTIERYCYNCGTPIYQGRSARSVVVDEMSVEVCGRRCLYEIREELEEGSGNPVDSEV